MKLKEELAEKEKKRAERDYLRRKLQPLQGDVTHHETSGLAWYMKMKEERAEREKIWAERDYLHRKMEMEEMIKQKDRELEDSLMKQEQIFQMMLGKTLANNIGSSKEVSEMKKGKEVDGDGSLEETDVDSGQLHLEQQKIAKLMVDLPSDGKEVEGDRSLEETDVDSGRLHLEQQKIAKLMVDLPSDGVYRGKAFTNRVFTSTPRTDLVDQNMGGPSGSGDTLNKGKQQSNFGNSRSRSRPSTPNKIQISASSDKSSHRSKKYSSSSSSCSTDVSDIPNDTESSSSASACDPRYVKKSHRKCHKAYRRRRHSPPAPKLPTCNGGTGMWRPFIVQFKEVATMNKWSKSTRRERLMGCLSGKALEYIERQRRDKHREYRQLLKVLEKRYGQVDPPSTIRTKLSGTQQEEKESLDDWADRIWGLTLDGYPGAPDEMVESLAVENFFRGCQENEAALAVSEGHRKIKTIRQALKYMKKYSYSHQLLVGRKSERIRSTPYQARQVTFATATGKGPNSDNTRNDTLDVIQKAIQEMGVTLAVNLEKKVETMINDRMRSNVRARSPSPANNGACFKCGVIGHFARECMSSNFRSPPRSPQSLVCYGCKEVGHLKRDCPKLQSENTGSPKVSGLGQRA